ncbi:MAG TPA: hypothetical protein VHR72_11320, partial [Gemmataceae bacterium]|nr:hypothetical protein [Gemmataceae bacterium]
MIGMIAPMELRSGDRPILFPRGISFGTLPAHLLPSDRNGQPSHGRRHRTNFLRRGFMRFAAI